MLHIPSIVGTGNSYDGKDWLWVYKKIKSKINLKNAIPIGEGGYGNCYRTTNGNIIKHIQLKNRKYFSEVEAVQNEYNKEHGLPLVKNDNPVSRFIGDIKNEITFQEKAHNSIKSIDGTAITPKILQGGVYATKKNIYGVIVMENMPGEGLGDFLKRPQSVEVLRDIKSQILRLLDELHKINISHNDMLGNNLIINEGVLHVIDWGLATPINASRYFTSTSVLNELPPEEHIDTATYTFMKEYLYQFGKKNLTLESVSMDIKYLKGV